MQILGILLVLGFVRQLGFFSFYAYPKVQWILCSRKDYVTFLTRSHVQTYLHNVFTFYT